MPTRASSFSPRPLPRLDFSPLRFSRDQTQVGMKPVPSHPPRPLKARTLQIAALVGRTIATPSEANQRRCHFPCPEPNWRIRQVREDLLDGAASKPPVLPMNSPKSLLRVAVVACNQDSAATRRAGTDKSPMSPPGLKPDPIGCGAAKSWSEALLVALRPWLQATTATQRNKNPGFDEAVPDGERPGGGTTLSGSRSFYAQRDLRGL